MTHFSLLELLDIKNYNDYLVMQFDERNSNKTKDYFSDILF